MAMTNEADFVSKTLKEVDDICTRYENILSRLESRQEGDEEERFQVKEATKTVIANLEKHAVLKMKETVSMTRILNLRLQSLIEKCERAFPQLEDLVRLKAMQTEIDALLNKAATTALSNCPLCLRFGGYRLFAQGAGENENVFLYVAEKIAASGKGLTPLPTPRPTSASSRIDDDPYIIGGGSRRRRKSDESRREREFIPNFDVRHATQESDTQAEVTPTARSDPSREVDQEKRKNLLWLEDDLDADTPEYQFLHRRSRRSRRRSARRRARDSLSSDEGHAATGTHEKSRPCIFCTLPERPKVKEPASPAVSASPVAVPQERPVDLIVSATMGPQPGISLQVQEKTPTSARTWIIVVVSTVFALNLIAQFILWMYGWLTSTTSWPGSMLWPYYCKMANRLCKADYNFACTDYCASRLERFLWGKK